MLDGSDSGGREGAMTTDPTMLLGGEHQVVDRARPVLDSMAKTVMRVGDIGAGCICRIAHNCAGFSLGLAMIECLSLGAEAGANPATIFLTLQEERAGVQVRTE